ncbi:MAG: response regulator [Chitinophagaceae bacterium]|nr:response regulator [Chitinophagaceae bacterium]
MIKILLVEDDLDDVELLEDALRDHNVAYEAAILHDGSAAVEYIRACTSCPDLVILDFNLPKVHGRQLILELKATASFKQIPLLILTTSSAKEDIDYAYQNGADKYLIKPTSMAQVKELVDEIVRLAAKQ